MKHYVVIGRPAGQDEDDVRYVGEHPHATAAEDEFKEWLAQEIAYNGVEEGEVELEDDGTPVVYITAVVSSDCEMAVFSNAWGG